MSTKSVSNRTEVPAVPASNPTAAPGHTGKAIPAERAPFSAGKAGLRSPLPSDPNLRFARFQRNSAMPNAMAAREHARGRHFG